MTSVAPAHRAAPHMTHTPDSDAPPQSQAAVSAVKPGAARPRLRDQIAENPLLSLFGVALTLFGTALVALLLFALNSINDRIDGLEVSLSARMDRLEARMDRLEAKVDAGFARQGAQIAELDARLTAQIAELDARLTAQIAELDARLEIAELERKLTGLIAHLNATAAVNAALEHRLLIPDAGTAEPEGEPPG